MRSGRLSRQGALVAGGLAIIGMALTTACSSGDSDEAPASSTILTSATPTPTDKGTGPGGNSFSPTVKPALPTDQSGPIANSH
jgi:hypothetical protein